MYKERGIVSSKVLLTGDISFQINPWLYLDFKGDIFHYKNKTYGVIVSVLPAAGFQVLNKRSILMLGLGFSLLKTGHKGHPDLPELTITAFSRYRYGITKVFGIFSEIRYGVTPYGNPNSHYFFLNAGISFQMPMNP